MKPFVIPCLSFIIIMLYRKYLYLQPTNKEPPSFGNFTYNNTFYALLETESSYFVEDKENKKNWSDLAMVNGNWQWSA